MLEQIAGIASEAAREKGKYVRMSVNYSQAVMELAVTDYKSGQEICREEANEASWPVNNRNAGGRNQAAD